MCVRVFIYLYNIYLYVAKRDGVPLTNNNNNNTALHTKTNKQQQ